MNKLIQIFILILVLSSCKSNQEQKTSNSIEFSYPKTILPDDTTQLWAKDGKIESDTVLIICQGGPSKNLTFVEKGRTSYRYIPNYANYYVAYLHQAQTLNKKMFEYESDFTIEMAEKEVDNTSEILYRALKYLYVQTVFRDELNYAAFLIWKLNASYSFKSIGLPVFI